MTGLGGLRDIRLILPRIKLFRCVLCNLQFTSFATELKNTRGVELSSEFSLNSNSDLARRFSGDPDIRNTFRDDSNGSPGLISAGTLTVSLDTASFLFRPTRRRIILLHRR